MGVCVCGGGGEIGEGRVREEGREEVLPLSPEKVGDRGQHWGIGLA